MDLLNMTLTLREQVDTLLEKYKEGSPPEDLRDRAFFQQVKEETTPAYDMAQKWTEQAIEFVKQHETKVHFQQILSTKDNLELLLMHSYYIDVKLKRYMELNYSVRYVFDLLTDDLKAFMKENEQ